MGAINCEPGIGSVLRIMQSTHPVRGGTVSDEDAPQLATFQSTHPVRGGTIEGVQDRKAKRGFQSTHPVRGGTCDRLEAVQEEMIRRSNVEVDEDGNTRRKSTHYSTKQRIRVSFSEIEE